MSALRKTAITVPEKLLDEVDRIAGLRGESRSAFIVRVLSVGVKARRDQDLRRRIDELFADEKLAVEQVRSAEELERAAVDWSEPGW